MANKKRTTPELLGDQITDQPSISEDPKRSTRMIKYAIIILVACVVAGGEFLEQRRPEPIHPASSLKKIKHLSDYLPSLKYTRGESEIYVFRGRAEGGKALIIGGTHPNEPASEVSAIVLAENIDVSVGTVMVIVRANNSGFTATEPQEGFPEQFTLTTRNGRQRSFRVGSRFTNILDGWPDPTVYKHYPSGQILSGNETRNLNRAYPGRKNGTLTERVAWAITELVRREKIDVVIDLHEAAPEYPVINAVVGHERAMDLASIATMELQMEGLSFNMESSPYNFHGLSHREIGDATDARAILMESAGALQGRLRGRTNSDIVVKSIDPLYTKAAGLGRLYVEFPEEGIPVEVRVGRHLSGIRNSLKALGEIDPTKTINISKVPDYAEVLEHGVGFYLR